MNTLQYPVLMAPETLAPLLKGNSLKIIYVGKAEKYQEAHLPGASHIEQASLNYGVKPRVGHLPEVAQLETLFRDIGLDNGQHVIACDDDGGTAAARLFWVLHAMGHRTVSFLDGGMMAWQAAGFPTTTEATENTPSAWTAAPDPEVLATKAYVLDNLDNPAVQVLDARSPEEHAGIKSASDRKGRIPGSVNLNWLDTRDPDNHNRLRPADTLRQMITSRGFDPDKEIVAHCQTHQRSCHSFMMLRSLGFKQVRGFDGSWSEWAADPDTPIETATPA